MGRALVMVVYMHDTYDMIVIGTGFASSFFLHWYLHGQPRGLRVLVLEAGQRRTHAQQVAEGDPLRLGRRQLARADAQMVNPNPKKEWLFFTGFGGGSNCWYACTPRLMSEDLRLHATYGIGGWKVTLVLSCVGLLTRSSGHSPGHG